MKHRMMIIVLVAAMTALVGAAEQPGDLTALFRTPQNVRAFVQPEAPAITLEVSGQTSPADVQVNVTFVDTAETVAQRSWQAAAGSPAQFDVAADLPVRYGIYQADASIDHDGKTTYARIRWAVLPPYPAQRKWDRLGLNVHVLDEDTARKMNALAVKWCRVDWMWNLVAPSGIDQIRWDYLDEQVAVAKQFGIEMLPILNTNEVPEYAKMAGHDYPFFNVELQNEFAAKIMDRYGDALSAVQLYNEPDYNAAANLGPDRESEAAELNRQWRMFLKQYLESTSAVIRAKCPDITIVGPGFPANPTNAGGWGELLDPPYSIGAALDAYSWHNYPAPRNAAPDHGPGSVIGIDQFVQRTRPKVRGHQVWITEQGYSSQLERALDVKELPRLAPFGLHEVSQGNYLVRLFLLDWEGGIDRAFIFHLNADPPNDDHSNPYIYYGLFTEKWNGPKLSFAQLAAMGHFLIDARYVGRVKLSDESALALAFERADQKVLVVWKPVGEQTIVLPPAWSRASAFDAFGNPLPPSTKLKISERPVYLTKVAQ